MYKSFSKTKFLDWQRTKKPLDEIIIACSNTDKSDRSEKYNFSIGFHAGYKNLSDEEKINIQIGDHKELVLCAFTVNNDKNRRKNKNINREIILKNLNKNGIKNIRISNQKEYFKELSNYKFIISPEGNGIDCHRHYESLMCGCIPIIEDNIYMRHKYSSMPVVYTKDYSEINKDFLDRAYDHITRQKYNFSKLFISYYSENDKKLLKKNGNFWCRRLVHKNAYNF